MAFGQPLRRRQRASFDFEHQAPSAHARVPQGDCLAGPGDALADAQPAAHAVGMAFDRAHQHRRFSGGFEHLAE